MLTCAVANMATWLQIALGIVIRDRANIELLHNFGITCTYDETLRFKSSAAPAAAKGIEKLGLSLSDTGHIQMVADNYDAEISSPNGLRSTHALAMLITQPDNDATLSARNKIKCLMKTEM